MAINFKKLPSDTPYSIPPAGYYLATISKAEMRTPTDPSKSDYLSLTMALYNAKGEKAGTLFDGQYESDAAAIQYKLQRFITALKLTTLEVFELKDLIKLVVGQQIVVEVENVTDNRDKDLPAENRRIRAQVRLFGSDIYWPPEEFKNLVSETTTAEAEVPFTFDAADGDIPADDTTGTADTPTPAAPADTNY